MLSDDACEHVFSFLTANCDCNAVSLVCRDWCHIERRSRRRIIVANCYAVTPATAIGRFTSVRAAYIKGKPGYADSNFFRGGAESWVAAMAEGWPQLEEVRLKRTVVNDNCLELIARSFKNLRVLALSSCHGLTANGLAVIAANCRNLKELDLPKTNIENNYAHWLSYFPESFTSLVSLDLANSLDGQFVPIVECLVSRCTNIGTLRLNNAVPLDSLVNLLHKAPQLVDLATHLFSAVYDIDPELFSNLESAFANCKGMKSLYLLSDVVIKYLPAIYSLWDGLTSLDLHNCFIRRLDLIILVSRCKNLQRLWVRDYIEDDGLVIVASSCKLLQELRVFPFHYHCGDLYAPTEHGLVAVSVGCPMLQYVYYSCDRMTNAALVVVARNRPNLTCFRLCILRPRMPDYVTQEPLDVGSSAIVESCKDLKHLSLAGLLTDDMFRSIGAYANRLEMLSIGFAGRTVMGLHYILSGCKSLRKLGIQSCPFGDKALLFNATKLEKMQTLWTSSCCVSLGTCQILAQVMPWLNMKVIHEMIGRTLDSLLDDFSVKRLYVYKTLAGSRPDTPPSVWIVRGPQGASIRI